MLVFTLLVILGIILQANGDTKAVTNEDIRNAILSLIHKARDTEDKLERHELRERALGDQIKKMLVTIDKRTKILDFVKATITKFDERLTKIESMFAAKEGNDKDQAQRMQNMMKDFNNLSSAISIFQNDVMQEMKTSKIEIPNQQQSVSKDDINNVQKFLSNKIDSVSSSSQKIQRDVFTLKTQNQNVENLSKQANERLENMTLHLTSNRKLLETHETKLEACNNCSKAVSVNINEVFEKQKNDTERILAQIKTVSEIIKTLPEKRDIQAATTSTTNSINSLISTVNGLGGNTKKLFDDKTKAVLDRINKIPLPKPAVTKNDINVAQKIVLNKIDAVSITIRNIQNELSKLKGEYGNVQQIHKQTNENIEKTKQHYDSIQDILVKYRNKLEEYNKTIEILPENIMQALDMKCNASEALTEIKEKIVQVAMKTDLVIIQNHTLKSLELLTNNIIKEISNSKKLFEDKSKSILAKINNIENLTPDITRENIKILADKIDPLKISINDVQEELSKLKLEHENSQNIGSQANQHMETVKMRLDNNEELLEKYENKLAKYNENIDILQQNDKAENGWHSNIIEVLEKQKNDVTDILNEVRFVSEKVIKIPEKDDLDLSKNETLKSIENLKINASTYINETKTLFVEKINSILNETNKIKESLSGPDVSKEDLRDVQYVLTSEIRKLNESIYKIHENVLNIQDKHNDFQKLEELVKENMVDVHLYFNDSQRLLDKYESKLEEYGSNIEILMFNDEEKHSYANISEVLEKQNELIEEQQGDIKIILNKTGAFPNDTDMKALHNQTLNTIQDLQINITKHFQESAKLCHKSINQLLENIENLHENNTELSQQVSDRLDILIMNVATSSQTLSDQIGPLSTLEQVVVDVADDIMDTKRRVEYGVERVLLEVGDMVKKQSKTVNATVSERFDTFQTATLKVVKEDIKNLTLKLGGDMDQIWRQIATMHQQLTANVNVLNKLQDGTDAYVNGSTSAMDSLKMKFNKVSNKTSEIDESVNFLMGKLFLISNEFKGIKADLGNALDEIKDGFREIKHDIQNKTLN